MIRTLAKDGILHLSDDAFKTKCGRSTVGMSQFEGWKSVCEKCYGPGADLETVAKKVGISVNVDKASNTL